MKIRHILLMAAGFCLTLGTYAQKKTTLYVPKAGTLVELLTENEANQITHLTLQGKLNAIDFRHLRDEFTNLKVLDISNATISMYTGKNGLTLTVSTSTRVTASRPMPSANRMPTAVIKASRALSASSCQTRPRT